MVNYFLYLFILLPSFLLAAEFSASVSHNPVAIGETFTLTLTLKDATAKEAPAIDSLLQNFSINSQQQSFRTTVINSKISSIVTWKFTLFPHKEGQVVIPALSISTSEGILNSDPIALHIVKGSPNSQSDNKHEIFLTAEVSNAKPYTTEPFIYSVKIISKQDLANIQTKKLQIEDAFIENHGEVKLYKKMENGIDFNVIEFEYLITPLKPGPLTIPSIVVQGLAPSKRKPSKRSYMDDDDFDFFHMMQGFDQFKPFSVSTQEIIVDVQPQVAGVTPWLAAKSLIIEEVFDDSQQLQVGEPFTRGFNISAEGVKSGQLPSLNIQQTKLKGAKIYADQAELSDETKGRTLKAHRKELYTFIPQEAGTLEIPEISIQWWDVTKNEKAVSYLPARKLTILPAKENSQLAAVERENVIAPPMALPIDQALPTQTFAFYAAIAVLLALLIVAILRIVFLQKKLTQAKYVPQVATSYKRPQDPILNKKYEKETLPDLNPR